MKTERSEGCLLEHHIECNSSLSLSLTHPSHKYWLVPPELYCTWPAVLFMGCPSGLQPLGLFIRVPSYYGKFSSGSIQRILSRILTSTIDFPERKHDDRTSQTKCHYIKLRSRCLTKTPKKTLIDKNCWQCFKTPDYPSIAPKDTPLRLVVIQVVKERKSIRVVVSI